MTAAPVRAGMQTERRRPTPRELRRELDPRDLSRPSLFNPAGVAVIGSSIALAALGVYAISLTAGFGAEGIGSNAMRQLIFVCIGTVACIVGAIVHHRRLGELSPFIYAGALALLLFLLAPGVPSALVTPRNGARAWIDFGPFALQPAEFAKIAFVLTVGWRLRYRKDHRRLLGFIPSFLLTMIPAALIILQPDLGSAMLFVPALFAMLLAAGAKLRHIALVIALGLALAPASYPFLLPHQKARIEAMIQQVQGDHSKADSTQYQSLKAITLVGAGGVAGLDAIHSRAVLDFNDLPEQHNDMIYAVIVNRFGLFGGLLVIGLYLTWTAGGYMIAAACRDPFGRLVAVGITTLLITQASVNMAVVLGIAPVVGITLPFVSAGGSSLIACMLSAGILYGISIRPHRPLERRSFEFGPDDD